LVEVQKNGKTVIYQLKLSVLEDALLGFAGLFGMGAPTEKTNDDTTTQDEETTL
jgi:hypothetical protein